mgnify:CR=1 FL=1
MRWMCGGLRVMHGVCVCGCGCVCVCVCDPQRYKPLVKRLRTMTALAYDDVNGLKSLQVCGTRVVALQVCGIPPAEHNAWLVVPQKKQEQQHARIKYVQQRCLSPHTSHSHCHNHTAATVAFTTHRLRVAERWRQTTRSYAASTPPRSPRPSSCAASSQRPRPR